MACDSLFGSDDDEDDSPQDIGVSGLAQNASASLSEVSAVEGKISILSNGSSIPGLYLFPGILPFELQEELLRSIVTDQIVTLSHPQAMLFPRASTGRDIDAAPRFLEPMLKILPGLLKDRLSPEDYAIVFDEKLPMQTIVNLYEPGQGITPHVDLPHRYAHPIIGVSLLSSTVMDFYPVEIPSDDSEIHGKVSILLQPGDIYVLLREARYKYKHGIAYRSKDTYRDGQGGVKTMMRGTRISVTLRRMLPDAGKLVDDG